MKKYILSIFLLALPILASAYDCQVDGIYYNLNSDEKTAEVTYQGTDQYGYPKSYYSGSVTITDKFTYDGVDYSVTSIGYGAFWGCCDLTSVTIPNTVTIIGRNAFSVCSGLTSVTIPISVSYIGDYAFSGCSGLTSIKVEDGNKYFDSRGDCNAIISTKANNLIAGCVNTIIPNTVTRIGRAAFKDCNALTSVSIPNSVIRIDGEAFYGCSGLNSLTIPNSVTRIDGEAFACCSGLTSVTIGSSLTNIGGYLFNRCTSLTSIIIPNSVTSIGEGAFSGCSGLTSVIIPKSVTNISYKVFPGCSSLTSIIVEKGNQFYDSRNDCNAIIETESNRLIAGCKNTIIPNTVITIGMDAFRDCTTLTSMIIPNSVTCIEFNAFTGCSDLTTITIASSVRNLLGEVFFNCLKLKEVYCLAEDIPSAEVYTFSNINLQNAILYVPAASLDNYKNTAPWSEFGTILPLGETGIENLVKLKAEETNRYTLDGIRGDGTRKGLNIIRMSDGTTKKVIVK